MYDVCACICDHRFAIKFSVALSTHSVFACFTNSLQVVEWCRNHVEIMWNRDFPPPASDPANGNLQKLQDRLDPQVVLPALSRLSRLRHGRVRWTHGGWLPGCTWWFAIKRELTRWYVYYTYMYDDMYMYMYIDMNMYLHTHQFAPLYPYIYIEKHIMYLFSLYIYIYSYLYINLRDHLGHVLFFAFWGLEDQSFPLSLGQRPSSSRSPGRNTIEAHVGRVQGSGEQTFRLQMSILPRICLYFWVRKGGFHSLKGSSLLSWVDYGAMSAVRCFGICCGCCGSSGCCRFCGWSSSACSLHTFSLVADNLGSFFWAKSRNKNWVLRGALSGSHWCWAMSANLGLRWSCDEVFLDNFDRKWQYLPRSFPFFGIIELLNLSTYIYIYIYIIYI